MATARKPTEQGKTKKEKEPEITDEQKTTREEVKKWIQKIEAAKKVKKAWQQLFRVDLAYEYRDGKQRPPDIPDGEWFTINKIYSNLMAELPTLYSQNPYFYIKLEKSFSTNPLDIAMYETKAKIRQSMLNYLKKELKLKEKSRVSILDAYFQFGVLKVVFRADMVDNPDADRPMTDDDDNIMMDEDTGQPIQQPKQLPANEAYVIARVHPNDFLFDAEAGTLEDEWNWLAQRIRRPLDDVKKDQRYNPAARETVKATEVEEGEAEKAQQQRKKGSAATQDETEPTMVVLWEIYNLKKKEWMVISEGCDKYMMAPGPLSKGVDMHPFGILRMGLLRDDSPYPVPPVSQWIDPQKAYCEIRSKLMTHRNRFNRKYEMWDGAFNDADDAASKLETGGDGTVLRKIQPGQAVFPISDAALDQNHIQELILIRGDFEELAVGSNQGGSGAGVDSATEAGIIEKRVSLREGDKVSLVMDFVTDTARKIDQLVQGNITKDHAVKVEGPDGEYWELVRTSAYDDIAGEYAYSINLGATTPQIPEIERAQWMSFLQLIASAPQLAMSKALLKRTAEMYHVYDQTMIDELYQIAQKMMSGVMQQPGGVGSLPGVADLMTAAQSKTGGMASGIANIRGGQQ